MAARGDHLDIDLFVRDHMAESVDIARQGESEGAGRRFTGRQRTMAAFVEIEFRPGRGRRIRQGQQQETVGIEIETDLLDPAREMKAIDDLRHGAVGTEGAVRADAAAASCDKARSAARRSRAWRSQLPAVSR